MHAEIIAIGTELTTGAKLDTNSQWLSVELAAVGLPVLAHTTIADDLPAMIESLRMSANRSDVVLITGGLGPTLDDLTREALARLAGVELVLHEPSLRHIREMFAKRKREMPERNIIQAQFPVGSEPIENPHGTAPGIWMALDRDGGPSGRCFIAAMPGVPSEMKPMFRDRVLPRLPKSDRVIRRARVNCFGVGESACEQRLGDITARGRDPEVGITVHEGTITLRIEAHGASETDCDSKIAATKQLIRERLGELVFGEEDEPLEEVVVRELIRRGQTVAVADETTGGILSSCLTAASRAEACFLGGLIGPTFPTFGTADPSRDAAQLATEVRSQFGADYGLAITGNLFASGNNSNEIPKLQIGFATATGAESHEHVPVADLSFARSRAAKTAIDLLRLRLT